MYMEIKYPNNEPGGAGKKMRNVSNIDQPSRELEEHDDSITASALGVYR
jgi:hypothetical protein